MIVVEGTSDSKRTFETIIAFINGADSGAFIYADGLNRMDITALKIPFDYVMF